MGFYLRKAFKAGPFRINLSKGGLGLSAGVTGARVGVNSRGQVYTHAGRHGLYHRKMHGKLGGEGARGGAGARRRASVQDVEVHTGVTYATDDPSPSSSSAHGPANADAPSPPPWKRAPGLLAGAGLAVLLLGCGAGAVALTVLGTLLLVAAVGLGVRDALRHRRATRFAQTLHDLVSSERDPASLGQAVAQLQSSASDVPDADRSQHGRTVYETLLGAIVQQEELTDDALARLHALEGALALDPAFVAAAKRQAFQERYLAAVADHELTEAEQSHLETLRRQLQIPPEDIAEELAFIRELEGLRRIREGQLPTVQPSVKLQRGEICHVEAPARRLKHRVLNTYQRDGVRYKERGYKIDKEGTLLVTSKRVLLVHQGTSSIRHSRILDVDVDVDRALVTLVKDGAQRPIVYTTPDALQVGATIATAAGVG